MQSIERLRDKLGRELAQSEHDAVVHCAREARRYGGQPPAQAMRAISSHARAIRPRLAPLWRAQPTGVRLGRAVGELFSLTRHLVLDWLIDAERSYRATLLGLRHGLDAARLLREVARVQHDDAAVACCDQLLDERATLLDAATAELRWFAEHPALALRSSHRVRAHLDATKRLAPRPTALPKTSPG